MRRKSLVVNTLVFFAVLSVDLVAGQKEIPSAASAVADDIVAASKRSVAVVDFTDLRGNVTELGRFIAEEMALGLVTARKNLSVVDRTHLRALMEENKLGSSGLIDPATARKLGQITGVEVLVTGTITPFADSVRVVVKVLDTDTARILGAASMDIGKTKTIEELLARDIGRSAGMVPGVPPSGQQAAEAKPGNVPVFQNDSIRVTLDRLAVTSSNKRAALSIVVENTSGGPLSLAFESNRLALSDDRATDWQVSSINGLETVRGVASEGQYTTVGPSEWINVIINFISYDTDTPATTLSFSAQVLYYASAGPKRVSIGLNGIKPTVQRR